MLTTSRDIRPNSSHSPSSSVVAMRWKRGYSTSKHKVNCVVRLHGVLLLFPAHLETFVFLLTASSSSISGRHSVRCFIGVISRLKRVQFCFSRGNFVVLCTLVYLTTVPIKCFISAIYNIPVRLLPRRIVTMGTYRL